MTDKITVELVLRAEPKPFRVSRDLPWGSPTGSIVFGPGGRSYAIVCATALTIKEWLAIGRPGYVFVKSKRRLYRARIDTKNLATRVLYPVAYNGGKLV